MKLVDGITKNILVILFLAIIFSFVFVFFYFVFSKIFIEGSDVYIVNGLGALMGAFFAFLFMRIADFLDRIYKREKQAYNEHIFLERYFNYTGNTIHHNIYLMEGLAKALDNGMLSLHAINSIPLRYEALLNLRNLDFINKLFSIMEDFKKFNDDIVIVNNWNNELRTALIQAHIPHEKYKEEAKEFLKIVLALKKFCENLFYEKLPNFMAENRLIIRKHQTLISKAMNFFFVERSPSSEEIEKEKKIVIKEGEESMKKDQKELEQMGLI